MKKLIAILLSAMLIFSLTACDIDKKGSLTFENATIKLGKSHTDFKGVSIKITNVIWNEQEIKIEVDWINDTDFEVLYGNSYSVEFKDGDKWVSCQKIDELYFTSIGYVLKPNKSQQKVYNLTDTFDISKVGTYRLKTDCHVYNNGKDAKATKCNLFAEFTVEPMNNSNAQESSEPDNDISSNDYNQEEHSFKATILEINNNTVLVKPFPEERIISIADQIFFGKENLSKIDAKVGSFVEITYKGSVMTIYPANINATDWKLITNLRNTEYTFDWMEKNDSTKLNSEIFKNVQITRIYANCFFAEPLNSNYQIKFNGKLSNMWCVGDKVTCTYENAYYDTSTRRAECDLIGVDTYKLNDIIVDEKPVIYLYPEKETKVSVKLTLDGELTCTYPEYNGGWEVTAYPDGTLIDSKGQSYNYLYWEGESNARYDLSKGFCVKGEDTAKFLETALQKLGLTRREANEFIVYWLPLMQDNKYNIITFQTDRYTDVAKLEITPNPDTLIRVFMVWQGVDEFVELPEQTLTAPERQGFTAVEWGGAEIKE